MERRAVRIISRLDQLRDDHRLILAGPDDAHARGQEIPVRADGVPRGPPADRLPVAEYAGVK